MFSCSLNIPRCSTNACFTYTLHTRLTFPHTCPWPQLVILLFFISILEYNCFTMLCQFLFLQKSEPAVSIHISPYPLPLVSASHPPYPTPLGCHTGSSWSPCAMQQLPTSHSFYIWQCTYVNAALSLHPSFPFPLCVLKSILYVCVSIPALPLGSSVPFFQIPYMCVSIRYLFFSL